MISLDTLEKLEFSKILSHISKYCVTEKGKSKILSLKPLDSLKEVISEGNKVNQAKEILIQNDFPPIDYLPDLTETLYRSRIEGVILGSKQILEVLKLAEVSRKLYQFLKPKDNEHNELLELRNFLFVDKVFEHQISKVFTESGEIRDDASNELRSIRNEIKEKEFLLQKLVNKLLKQLSESYLVQEEYITQRDGRIVLPVKAEHKRHVRGFIHSESSTGQTVYIEPEETLELNNEILSLKFAEKREIEKILKTLTLRIGNQCNELLKSLDTIAELDSIFARAKYSIEIIGSFPSFDESKSFQIIDGRHPLLIKKIGINNTVPLNLKIDKEKVIVITGPNAGGKTVALKTMGILVLMAQSGIPIPANPDSNFHYFEKVLVDIGDAQSIEDDLSTFSSHLTNIKNIIEEASKKTLVLIDEIGTGTDPTEGAAIASGVLVTLRDKGAIVLATTHHGSLKVIANQLEGFQNASMEFDTNELKPTYIFNQGMPGSSYAFEVAQRIGLDEKFINLAKEFLETDKIKIEEFLISLEKKSKALREQLHKLELENLRLKSLSNLYQEKIDKLEKQKKEILADTKRKADEILGTINKKLENAIKNIKESNAARDVIKREKQEIEITKKEIKKIFLHQVKEESQYELKVGDYASIKGTTSVGIIEEMDKEKDKALLTIGSIKIKAKYSELVPAKKSEIEDYQAKKFDIITDNINFRLDIRGKRADEAELEIIKFLDNANMQGLDKVEILHGKGTGALKQLVKSILTNYKGVKNFYYANIEYGGDGITIVEFQ
ncbi:endonuclease MutS2 [Ignavibacteria bacterium 4148-Me]|uniref:endonuclease MutS2 n=1 Tax=Rosettibacter primus TaxID=3111523 RepID=UPI00336BD17B